MYIYIYIYIYIYVGCFKKRRLYTTKVSCYLESSVILLYYALKLTKINVKNNASTNISSNEIKDIRIQFWKTLSETFY